MARKGLSLSYAPKRVKAKRTKLYRALGSGSKRRRKGSDTPPGKYVR
ncbi:hypothetical protein H6794_00650 [Candidatus Nomurabacteria bacterium]|nr:hypothetical protein [Candidatus Saccharibacteria bacterium]MCB9839350.1 hypothetical protein [Candidatus Nomurabacteria bacterium]